MTVLVITRGKLAVALGLAAAALTLVLAGVLCGCGDPTSSTTTPVSSATTSGAGGSSPSTTAGAPGPGSTSSLEPAAGADIAQTFAQLATSLESLVLFAPTELPSGAALAPEWLPVLESADPRADPTSSRPNPLISGEGADAEVQVVLQVGAGWLVIVENFHGDLGDVAGNEVASVDGHPARLYEVNGGELVQWSVNGSWYGVFGRGVPRDAILAVALNMVQISAESL